MEGLGERRLSQMIKEQLFTTEVSSAVILGEGDCLCSSKLFYLIVYVNAYTLLRVSQKLSTFYGKGCSGREAHWHREPRFLCYVADCHGHLS